MDNGFHWVFLEDTLQLELCKQMSTSVPREMKSKTTILQFLNTPHEYTVTLLPVLWLSYPSEAYFPPLFLTLSCLSFSVVS